jgi:hypothetical protein
MQYSRRIPVPAKILTLTGPAEQSVGKRREIKGYFDSNGGPIGRFGGRTYFAAEIKNLT